MTRMSKIQCLRVSKSPRLPGHLAAVRSDNDAAIIAVVVETAFLSDVLPRSSMFTTDLPHI